MTKLRLTLVLGSTFVTSLAYADTLEVGPGKPIGKPCEAFAKAKDGDTIQIDAAGDYKGDLCSITKNNLTIRGVNGRAKIDGDGKTAGGKGIWNVAGNDTTIENIELFNAKSVDQNGAGIRQEGKTVTIRSCSFHDNENGILAGDNPGSIITIESSEFAKNGFGDGFTHNLYINHVDQLVFQFNYSHDAKIGHLLKSRAKKNIVAYNRLTDEGGTASYEIDLPNAGSSIIVGNIIEQSPNTDNPNIIAYGEEGVFSDWATDLYVGNNTIVNRRPNGGTFVFVGASITTKAQLTNNIFFGKGNVTTQTDAVQTTNYTEADPKLADTAKLDVHLLEGSPCVDKGTTPPTMPEFHYVHPASKTGRKVAGTAIDIGAYELNGDDVPAGGSDAGTSGGASSSGSTTSGGTTSGGTTSSGGGNDGGATNAAAPAAEDDGCGCRTTPSRSSAAAGVAAILALTLVARRRRVAKK